MRTTALFRATQAAVRVLQAAPDLARVDVVNGPPLEWDPVRVPLQYGDGNRYVFIGADPESDDGDSATAAQTWAGTGLPRDKDENFTISCVAIVLDGAGNIEQAQNSIEAVLIAIEMQLLSHLDLSLDPLTPGPVLYSGFGGIDRLKQFYSDTGITISAQFGIVCRAYLTN